MSLDDALSEAIDAIPDCVAGAYIDTSSGLLLSAQTNDSISLDVLETVAAATTDMFSGPAMSEIADVFEKPQNGLGLREFIVFGDEHIHVFLRTRKYPEHVVSMVCRNGANVGLVLARSRMNTEKLAEAI